MIETVTYGYFEMAVMSSMVLGTKVNIHGQEVCSGVFCQPCRICEE